MSRNFRKGMRELVCCSIRGGGRGRGSQRHYTSSFMRKSSTRTTTKALSLTATHDSWLERCSLRRSRTINRSAKSRSSLGRRNSLQNKPYALNEMQNIDMRPNPFVTRSSSTATIVSVAPERCSYKSHQPRTNILEDNETALWHKVDDWWWRYICFCVERTFLYAGKLCLSWNNARKLMWELYLPRTYASTWHEKHVTFWIQQSINILVLGTTNTVEN